MKFEKNMYIRTMDGISKIIEIRKAESMTRVVDDYGNIYFVDDLIGEPSYDIIDLVQIGDYVNGYRVDEIHGGQLSNFSRYDGRLVNIVSCDNNIERIVTKEQFENVEYEVVE